MRMNEESTGLVSEVLKGEELSLHGMALSGLC